MARTRRKPASTKRSNSRSSTVTTRKRSSAKGPKVAITRRTEDRRAGNSVFLRLDTDDKFVGYALFDPNPDLEDNPGYKEYGEHYDQPRNRFVPCWGEKNGCIYCKAGQSPSTRAMTAFLVTELNGEKLDDPELRLFRMNYQMLQEWWDTLDEDGSTIGQKIRIKCVSRGDGDYTTKFYEKDRLPAKKVKSSVKDIPDIEDLLQKQLDRELEALKVDDVLEEDEEDEEDIEDEEDEEEDEKPKARSKRSSKKDEEDEEEDDDDDDDEDESDDEEDEDEEDEDEEDGDEEESDDDDEDESEDDDDEEDDEEESEDGDSETISGEYTVVSANESENNITLKELDSDMYFSAEVINELDFDNFKKGDKVKLEASQDEDGDWVATSFSKVKKSGSKTGAKRGRPKKT